MAEFCLDCWNRLNESNDSEKKFILSKDLEFCEGCGEWKPIIIMMRKGYYMRKFRYFFFSFKIIYTVIYILWRLLIFPYLIFKYKKSNNKPVL